MNLLKETTDEIRRTGHTPADIVYIGSRDGYSCTWDEFTRLADVEYDAGYGGQEVASDLEVHFSDGSWLERSEYDGSECWEIRRRFVPPAETKPIRRLTGGMWSSLAGLHEDEDAEL